MMPQEAMVDLLCDAVSVAKPPNSTELAGVPIGGWKHRAKANNLRLAVLRVSKAPDLITEINSTDPASDCWTGCLCV